MSANSEIYLNDLATRSFRDVADQDYIAARACFRSGLMVQFAWMAHQAIEKYLKAILIYNKTSSKDLGHDLSKSLRRVKGIENMKLDFSASVIKFIEYLDDQGPNRYMEKAHFTKGMEMLELDRAVWQIRRYCKVINYHTASKSDIQKNMMELELKSIHSWLGSEEAHKFRLIGGHLEKVIKNQKNPQRDNLVWCNFYYGVRRKRRVKVPNRMNAVNPTQIMHPEHFEEYDRLVHFPKEVRNYFLNQVTRK